jgi:hypothetical protein
MIEIQLTKSGIEIKNTISNKRKFKIQATKMNNPETGKRNQLWPENFFLDFSTK